MQFEKVLEIQLFAVSSVFFGEYTSLSLFIHM